MKRSRFIFLLKLLGPGLLALLAGLGYLKLYVDRDFITLYAAGLDSLEITFMYIAISLGLLAVVWSVFFPQKPESGSVFTKSLLAVCLVCWLLGLIICYNFGLVGITIELILFIAIVWIYFSLYAQQKIKAGFNIPFLYFFFRIGGFVMGLGVWIVYYFYYLLAEEDMMGLPSIDEQLLEYLLFLMLGPLIISGFLYVVKAVDEHGKVQYDSMVDRIGE